MNIECFTIVSLLLYIVFSPFLNAQLTNKLRKVVGGDEIETSPEHVCMEQRKDAADPMAVF